MLARSGMQVGERSSEVMGRNLGGLLSSTIWVGEMMFGGRLGYVMGKYSRDLLSSTVLEGRQR